MEFELNGEMKTFHLILMVFLRLNTRTKIIKKKTAQVPPV